jgi:hypothetical protein
VNSSAEQEILELLDELPTREIFYDVDTVMERLINLRPRRSQPLPERARSVEGKSASVKGGRLYRTCNILIPGDMDAIW